MDNLAILRTAGIRSAPQRPQPAKALAPPPDPPDLLPVPIRPLVLPTALALALLLLLVPAGFVWAQAAVSKGLGAGSVTLEADQIKVVPDVQADAKGSVEFRRGGTRVRADSLHYDNADDRLIARGSVRIDRSGAGNAGAASYSGPELQLQVQRFEGFFLQPEFEFSSYGSGGRAARVDFLGESRSRAEAAVYSSCPRDGSGLPDWLLTTTRVTLDFERNDAVAEGAVLRFLNVPILAVPSLSFALNDTRRSGWLPPAVGLDTRNGLVLGVPWYWNIAPNRDATLTPTVISRRGLSLDTEFRYLEPGYQGQANLHLLPDDRLAGHSRAALRLTHIGQLGGADSAWQWQVAALHVSDQNYWKDFPTVVGGITPRLLGQDFRLSRPLANRFGPAEIYARVQDWQVLQTGSGSDLIVAPYQRSPQLGARWRPSLGGPSQPFKLLLEAELNHFTLPDRTASDVRPNGWRAHALGAVERAFGTSAWYLTPRMTLNAASYHLDQPAPGLDMRSSRVIPTLSLDMGAVFERDSRWFGQSERQTLEPRLLYVNTPFRDQTRLPNFDAAASDFNPVSVYAENAFSGIDRVSDSHQITAGVTTRLYDPQTGAETLRLGVAQRLLLRDQQVTPDGVPVTHHLSDLLLDGSTTLLTNWRLDASTQFDQDRRRVVRSILGARYSPGPFRTVSAGYRLARNLSSDIVNQRSEQLEMGWQWPVYKGTARPLGASGGCGGTLFAVGRVNYSLKDSRITDSVVGVEYDAGCWVGRIVSERLSTGRSEATTRLMLQLELIGLSRLGSNPLQVLKDNIPGYRLLREPRAGSGSAFSPGP